jgi:hypothetical protein
MVILMVVGILIGAALGLRFKVLSLIPVICVALSIIVGGGMARGVGFSRLALVMITIAVFLQLGYMLGNVVRFVMRAVRVTNHSGISVPTAAGMSESV